MDFPSIVRALNFSIALKIEERVCPDQYIGTVSSIESTGGITSRSPASCRPDDNGLLLVLESPHIEEFKGQPAPAKGKTGTYIANYLGEALGLDDTEIPVTLINAVQYQCSLGQPTGQYRDKIFTATWVNGGKQDFAARLKDLYRMGDTVICCCTKGNNTIRAYQLRQMVYVAICEVLPNAQVLRRTHPSSWNVRRNRFYEWGADA